jgi:hypothetical protein
MGKKAKTKAGKIRAENRKVKNVGEIPPPPPLEDEVSFVLAAHKTASIC